MGHNSVVSGYSKFIGSPWVDGLSTGPLGFGASQKMKLHQGGPMENMGVPRNLRYCSCD